MNLEDQLKRDEAWRAKPYDDATGKTLIPGSVIIGKITVGYGRNLSDSVLSATEGIILLRNDIQTARIQLQTALAWTENLDEVRKAVLVTLTFNMGIVRLLGFRDMLAKLRNSDYAGAAQAMLDSKWASQVGDRAKRLSKQMEVGEWQ